MVVFPASICAAIPILRVLFNGYSRDIYFLKSSQEAFNRKRKRIDLFRLVYIPPPDLPAIMSEGLVGLSHLVTVLFFLHARAGVVGGIY